MKALLVAALAVCSAAALAGCEEQSYPTPSADQAPPPPPPPPAPLMGAPAQTPPPPYAPCAETPCGPEAPAGPPTAPRVIASTPVPNPPEPEYRVHRRHSRFWTYGQAPSAAPPYHVVHPYRGTGWHVVGPATPHHVHAHGASAPAPAAHGPAHHPATPAAPAPLPHHHHQAAASTAPAPHKAAPRAPAASAAPAHAGGPINNIMDNSTGAPTGPEADRYNSLQTALGNLVGIDGVLTTPDHFQTNETVDVTLTLPANFAQEVHDEAAKAGLSDAAASVNIDAHLTGTGFTITPDQAQAQPLLLGQATIFHWKVTPTTSAVGAVKAEVTADLQTVGRSLQLGTVQSQAGVNNLHVSGRVLGVGLLIMVLVIVAGWILNRSGRGPAYRRKDI